MFVGFFVCCPQTSGVNAKIKIESSRIFLTVEPPFSFRYKVWTSEGNAVIYLEVLILRHDFGSAQIQPRDSCQTSTRLAKLFSLQDGKIVVDWRHEKHSTGSSSASAERHQVSAVFLGAQY